MYTVYYTIYNVQCTRYNVHCTMFSVQCAQYNVLGTIIPDTWLYNTNDVSDVLCINVMYMTQISYMKYTKCMKQVGTCALICYASVVCETNEFYE